MQATLLLPPMTKEGMENPFTLLLHESLFEPLENHSRRQLRTMARARGITGSDRMNSFVRLKSRPLYRK
jgi:hypothetical protein